MKITFPHMGPVFAYQKLFESLGHEVIVPSRPTARTIELGIRHSPEFICFPFKIILGSYLEALAKGADTIVTTGFIGACRAVYYGNMSERILRHLGYDVRVMVFDSPFENLAEFKHQCRELGNHKNLAQVARAFNLILRLIYLHDHYQKKINHLRPYEKEAGTCNQKWLEIKGLLVECQSAKTLREVTREAEQIIAGIALDPNREVLRVGLVGEIYLVMEDYSNNYIENKLARLGVEVVRNQYISHWLNHFVKPPRKMLRETEPYLKYSVGGHEKENIGSIQKYGREGFDGVIHLLPFGCMPELVTQTIIPRLSTDLNLPILSLSLDEQTGWTNNMIRLEAFVELLWSRHELAKKQRLFG